MHGQNHIKRRTFSLWSFIMSQINAVRTLSHYFVVIGFNIVPHLCLVFPSGLFPSDCPTEISYSFLNYLSRVLLYIVILLILKKTDILDLPTLLSPTRSHAVSLDPNIILGALSWNTFYLEDSSLVGRDVVSLCEKETNHATTNCRVTVDLILQQPGREKCKPWSCYTPLFFYL
jgi:hypothetical protein